VRKKTSIWAAMYVGVSLSLAIANARGDSAPTETAEVVKIWPGAAPGTDDWTGPEVQTLLPLHFTQPTYTVTNVTTPTLTVYRPAPGSANGTAVVVCPGGGFQNLAITHEGLLVAQWLADRGITAFVLKYRVRPSPGFRIPPDIRRHPDRFAEFAQSMEAGRRIAVADGIQAMRYLRTNAAKFGIAPDRIGIMGFSAGAMTTMGVVMDSEPADRPNFGAPIYGAMEKMDPPKEGPPLFIAATQDDAAVPVAESVAIFSSWTAADLRAELHLYERGGHGFGMVPHHLPLPVDNWTGAFEAWLKTHSWITSGKP
jgi:acetyl esterase/lipase